MYLIYCIKFLYNTVEKNNYMINNKYFVLISTIFKFDLEKLKTEKKILKILSL